jgi:hypothetical protein
MSVICVQVSPEVMEALTTYSICGLTEDEGNAFAAKHEDVGTQDVSIECDGTVHVCKVLGIQKDPKDSSKQLTFFAIVELWS